MSSAALLGRTPSRKNANRRTSNISPPGSFRTEQEKKVFYHSRSWVDKPAAAGREPGARRKCQGSSSKSLMEGDCASFACRNYYCRHLSLPPLCKLEELVLRHWTVV